MSTIAIGIAIDEGGLVVLYQPLSLNLDVVGLVHHVKQTLGILGVCIKYFVSGILIESYVYKIVISRRAQGVIRVVYVKAIIS